MALESIHEVNSVRITAYTPASEVRQVLPSLSLRADWSPDPEPAVGPQGGAEPQTFDIWQCQEWLPPEELPPAPTTSRSQHCKKRTKGGRRHSSLSLPVSKVWG